ncbi:isochorismate synthase [Brevundimonas faecalis]|uniref:isochorismate synthase n=1 Tax=Brevundimonas faecalis TaxID=947378 RepID=A0ABV2R6E4_9CAUL
MDVRTAEFWGAPDLSIQIGGDGASERRTAEQGGGDSSLDWAFGLTTPELRLFTTGMRRRLTPGPAATLGERTRRFFADLPPATETKAPSPRLLVGALPFDREAEDRLFLPQRAANRPWASPRAGAVPLRGMRLTSQPSRAHYQQAVARALEAMRASRDGPTRLDKAVLSRSLLVQADAPIDPFALWRDLKADPTAARFLVPLGQGQDGAMRRLVGATPELLVSKRGPAVLSHPLAGSARRSADLSQDEAAAQDLLASEKDRREHALVVEAIMDLLTPWCSDLRAPPAPALVSTRTMWHLGTRIEGRLHRPDETSAADLAALLHPTPAVCGSPRDQAAELIRDLEGYDRGFYAGAVGWTNASGDGAWYVSLRCAEVCGDQARLYAGAGVVEGSDPAAEADETSGKFQAVLRALGVDEASL